MICTLTSKESSLDIEAIVTRGRGYKTAAELKRKDAPIGVITLDCNYSPVERVAFEVANTRVGSATDFEKLGLTIETNGTKSPDAVLGEGAAELKKYLNWITEKQSSMMTYVPVEEPIDTEMQAEAEPHRRPRPVRPRYELPAQREHQTVGELVDSRPSSSSRSRTSARRASWRSWRSWHRSGCT